ncbi:MAG: DUF2378 family protein [Polyangiaceae bacterium]
MPFRPPRFGAPPPVEATIAALPEKATCLGLYFNDVIDAVARSKPDFDIFAATGLTKKRYFPFFSYSYADVMRLISAAAKVIHPRVSHGEALRRMGHSVYDKLFGTRVGHAMFGALGHDVRRILLTGPRGYDLSMNFGKLTAEGIDSQCVVYHFRDLPGLIETYQVGVIEGALRNLGVAGTVTIALTDVGNADVEIRWISA